MVGENHRLKRPRNFLATLHWKNPLYFLAITGVGLYWVHSPLLASIGNYIAVQDDVKSADIIHVIAGLDHRLDYAIQLYLNGYAQKIFFTGGWCEHLQDSHADHSTRRALQRGIPANGIATDSSMVESTFAEVVALKKYIDRSDPKITSVIMVSDTYHMRRVRWTCRKVLGPSVRLTMAPVPLEQSPYRRRWWRDKQTALFVGREYLKMLFYHARYQWTSGRLRDMLSTFDKY